MTQRASLRAAFAAILAVLVLAPAATALPKGPTTVEPARDATVKSLPAFAWKPVANIDHYEFEIAADSGFDAPVLGDKDDHFDTRNTRAALRKAIPNGEYWWRVRAVRKGGTVTAWSKPANFKMSWTDVPTPLKPDHRSVVTFPTPSTLVWSPVAGAAKYRVVLASDPGLGTAIESADTQATRFTAETQLKPGVYYWNVTPIDNQGHAGVPSAVWSFEYRWPSTTTVSWRDLAPEAGVVDPLFEWQRVPGAASYELEINSTSYFAASAKVCCTSKILGTSYSPVDLFADNRYYWRVRAVLDAKGLSSGEWNEGTPVDKSFDKAAVMGTDAVGGLLIRDHDSAIPDDAVADTAAPNSDGYQTQSPLVAWNPVPGAMGYDVDVILATRSNISICVTDGSVVTVTHSDTGAPAAIWESATGIDGAGEDGFLNVLDVSGTCVPTPNLSIWVAEGSYLVAVDPPGPDPVVNHNYDFTGTATCDWAMSTPSHWDHTRTGNPYWTPLGSGWDGEDPFEDDKSIAHETSPLLLHDKYCVRVRAFSDRDKDLNEIRGDYTYLSMDGKPWSFQFWGYPTPVACTPSCTAGYLGANDFLGPQSGVTSSRTPLFTWRPVARSYYVIVAKDASLENIVDYGFTQVPAYAPRYTDADIRVYPDEETFYYWTVIPASNVDGSGVTANLLQTIKRTFVKQSVQPALQAPAAGTVVTTQPRFEWSRVEGAKRYVLQVASDTSFSTKGLLDNVITAGTSYTSAKTYPADSTLYWRVRAEDVEQQPMRWSAVGMFNRKLGIPVVTTPNPSQSDGLPTWAWNFVEGALSYDIEIETPDGKLVTFADNFATANDPIQMTGTGDFRWRVRANFPTGTTGSTAGAFSPTQVFTRTIGEPGAPRTTFKNGVLLAWESKPGAAKYRVQISRRQDFASKVESEETDGLYWAPTLDETDYKDGGVLYWRVAAVDLAGTIGDFTTAQVVRMAARMSVKVKGGAKRGKLQAVTITVKSFDGKPVAKALVSATGAGLKPVGARTNKKGVAILRVKPRKPGSINFRITRSGFQPQAAAVKVK